MSKYTIIKNELGNNPGLYGSKTDQEVVDELNAVNKERNRTSMSRAEIYENIESTALTGLTSLKLDKLNLALSDFVNPFGNAAQVFIDVFGGGSATITALQAARVETVSQAAILSISKVKLGEIEEARA